MNLWSSFEACTVPSARDSLNSILMYDFSLFSSLSLSCCMVVRLLTLQKFTLVVLWSLPASPYTSHPRGDLMAYGSPNEPILLSSGVVAAGTLIPTMRVTLGIQ